MFLGAPDFARSEKKHSHRFSIFCVFTQPRSKADMTPLIFDVRFTPKSGHSSLPSRCQLWARSGHCKLLQTHSGTGPEFNDGDECNQNKDRQCHGLRDRERRFRLCRSQRIEG